MALPWVLVTVAAVSGCGPDVASGPGGGSVNGGTVTGGTATPEAPPGPAASGRTSAPTPAQGVVGQVTAGGRPVPGAMVQPAPGRGNTAPEREVFAVTAADGHYGLGLSPGAWVVTISADGYEPAVVRVTVPAGGLARGDVTLQPLA